MAEDNDNFIEDDAIALEDSDDSSIDDVDTSNIIPFIVKKSLSLPVNTKLCKLAYDTTVCHITDV